MLSDEGRSCLMGAKKVAQMEAYICCTGGELPAEEAEPPAGGSGQPLNATV